MEVRETTLPGVKIFTPKLHEDSRGGFSETYNKQTFDSHAPDLEFVQDNESFSAAAFTIRGLHYQAPPAAQAKLVRCVQGRIFDVVVDIRNGSPTYGQWVSEELSRKNRKQLLAPEGFLHGFMTLEPDTIVAYKVTNFYDKAADGAVHWASPALSIDWPVGADHAKLSEKDANAVDFAQFSSPFSV